MIGIKWQCNPKHGCCHQLGCKVSRFAAAFSVFFFFSVKLEFTVRTLQLWPSGLMHRTTSTAIEHLEVASCTGTLPAGPFDFMVDHRTFQNWILSGVCVHLWEPPKKPISDLLHCSLYLGKNQVLFWGIYERVFTCSLITHVHTNYTDIFQICFHDNFSLNVGNLQHAVLVAVWFNQKILAEGLAYMAELLMLIPTFLQKMRIALR